jgi:uncharacterized protein YjdB
MQYKTFLFFILALFTLSCSDSKPDRLVQYYEDDFNSSVVLATNTERAYHVYAHYDDGEKEDVSSRLLWSSSDTTLATVAGGLVSTLSAVGFVDISYKTPQKLSDGSYLHENNMTLEVKDLNISSLFLTITPSQKVFVGKSGDLMAEATFEDNSTGDVSKYCDFNSSNLTVATIDTNSSTIEGISEGNVTVFAHHREQNLSSNSLAVEIVKVEYTSIELVAQRTTFNLQQSIALEVRGSTNDGQIVVLDASELTWKSLEEEFVRVDKSGVAIAVKKGKASIEATLRADTSLVTTLELAVLKDEYVRLFDGSSKELVFDTPLEYIFLIDDNKTLATFTIKAVGREFTISELNVTDFAGHSIFGSGTNYFDTLENGDTILEDENLTFSLIYDNVAELIYTFKIDDDVGSRFIQRFKED